MHPAQHAREQKRLHPERYCAHRDCLWQQVVRDDTHVTNPCQNHPGLPQPAPRPRADVARDQRFNRWWKAGCKRTCNGMGTARTYRSMGMRTEAAHHVRRAREFWRTERPRPRFQQRVVDSIDGLYVAKGGAA